MTRALRQRHRIMVLALSALVPAAFVVGVASRRAVPVPALVPSALAEAPGSFDENWMRDDLWEKEQLRTRFLSDSTHSRSALEITAPEPVVRPDMLVYWVPGNPNVDASLPSDSILLGAWAQSAGKPVSLPQAAMGDGKLILYSLADHEIVNVTKPFSIP